MRRRPRDVVGRVDVGELDLVEGLGVQRRQVARRGRPDRQVFLLAPDDVEIAAHPFERRLQGLELRLAQFQFLVLTLDRQLTAQHQILVLVTGAIWNSLGSTSAAPPRVEQCFFRQTLLEHSIYL